jgi:hypothetical protein
VTPRAVVLVEGDSDAVVVMLLARRNGLAEVTEVVSMGGVTNVGRHVRRLALGERGVLVLGLCDAPERRFLERAEPALDGIFVCDRDLEEELIRAVGPDQVLDVLDELDELGRFRTFQAQPEWRERPLPDQLRRFAGTRSGRKAVLAERLADRLTPGTTPRPLVELFALVERQTVER